MPRRRAPKCPQAVRTTLCTPSRCASPTLIAFGADAYRVAADHIPHDRYSRLVKVRHYSDYMSKEAYRARVPGELDD
jgi:hypothetical protein